MELPPEERLNAGDLIAELVARTPNVGPNECGWPGLTAYKFTSPIAPQWDDVRSLSLCVVAQGRKCVRVDDDDHRYDPFNYLILARGMRFRAEILEASVEKPFLSFVLQIDPSIVKRISGDMLERTTTTFRRPLAADATAAYVSPLDQNLIGAVLRFVKATDNSTDRRVLAPMYLQEVVYRILQEEQCSRLVQAACSESEHNPVTAVINHVQERMSEPLTVADLAEFVSMSPSAFATLFREVTGLSPYQFVKRMRLDRARCLLIDGDDSVGEVARAVGYGSISHFINEFKRHFGVTPRAYADVQRRSVALHVDEATARA
jgi:AraC-like DNA-binding protein